MLRSLVEPTSILGDYIVFIQDTYAASEFRIFGEVYNFLFL